MKYCIYWSKERDEFRMGAQAPWDSNEIVDVHFAEVARLAERTGSRRASEVAEHLVPAGPSEFFAAGATAWEFAREAVGETEPGALTPRGEAIVHSVEKVQLVPILEHLLAAGEQLPVAAAPSSSDAQVAAVIRRHTHRVAVDDAWDHVVGFLRFDDLWLSTADELAEGDSETFCAVAALIASHSAEAELEPGDIVFSAGALQARTTLEFAEVLASL